MARSSAGQCGAFSERDFHRGRKSIQEKKGPQEEELVTMDWSENLTGKGKDGKRDGKGRRERRKEREEKKKEWKGRK